MLAPLLAGISGGFLGGLLGDFIQGKSLENQVARAIQIRNIMTSLGPAYIKLGQALSIRPDLLSPAAMNELQKLCDKVGAPGRAPSTLCAGRVQQPTDLSPAGGLAGAEL